MPEHGLERLATADFVVVTSWDSDDDASPALQNALRAAVDRGSRVLAHCTGAFAVAARRAGFGSAAGLREHFVRERGVTPQAYRRTFATASRVPPA